MDHGKLTAQLARVLAYATPTATEAARPDWLNQAIPLIYEAAVLIRDNGPRTPPAELLEPSYLARARFDRELHHYCLDLHKAMRQLGRVGTGILPRRHHEDVLALRGPRLGALFTDPRIQAALWDYTKGEPKVETYQGNTLRLSLSRWLGERDRWIALTDVLSTGRTS